MKTFDVYERAGALRAVKQGWCWPAFFFGGIWGLFAGLWARATLLIIAWLITYIATTLYGIYVSNDYAADYGQASSIDAVVATMSFAYLGLKVYTGMRGNHWRRSRIKGAGFELVATLEAAGKGEAVAEYRKTLTAPKPFLGLWDAPLHPEPFATAAAASHATTPSRAAAFTDLDPTDGRDSRLGDVLCLALAAVIGVAAGFTVIGLLPVGILLIGLAFALQKGEAAPLKTATAIVAGFGIVLLAISVTAALLLLAYLFSEGQPADYTAFDATDALLAALVVGALSLTAILALRYLWLRPLLRQLGALRSGLGGIKAPDLARPVPVQKIVTREGLQTYSVADEIAKWKALHADGVIDDAEYQRARAQLLK